jgi:hypothetical protein
MLFSGSAPDLHQTCILNTTLDQVKKLPEQLGIGELLGGFKQGEESEPSTLADNFVAPIRKAAKPELKFD